MASREARWRKIIGRSNDKGLPEVVSRWEQLLRFAALRLGRELGAEVQVATSRKEAADPGLRFAAQAQSLVSEAALTGSLKIPDAVAPVDVVADLRGGRITVSIDVDAPREGRATTRINWLIRQLKDAPDGLRIDAFTVNARSSTSDLLFRVAATSPMGTKRGTGRGGFIDSVLSAVDGFYEAVAQQITPWAARAPKLPKSGRTAAEEAGLDLTPPPLDRLEQTSAAELILPPAEQTPDLVADAVEDTPTVHGSPFAQREASDGTTDAPDVVLGPMVSWDAAQDRLDNERRADRDASTDEAD